MGERKDYRVAWLLPAMGTGGLSFQHLLCEFTKIFPNTVAFTGQWPGYAPSFENSFTVQEVGATQYIELAKTPTGYTIGFSYASPAIIHHLFQFKPQVIFANAFSIWTMLALLLKPIGKWKVIIIYEGGSPTYESRSPSVRLILRRMMVRLADAFVVNSRSGKTYLTDVLRISSDQIFARPFLVPSVKALLQCPENSVAKFNLDAKHPIFLYVGQIIPRKGLKVLLEAFRVLKEQGYENYTVRVVGDGEQRAELELFAEQHHLSGQIEWIGQVEYRCLGIYFQTADVFVFPTHEDIWGMVLTEAMAFGKPVICSEEAGAAEMVEPDSGFVFNPKRIDELSAHILHFLDNPASITRMGQISKQIMLNHTPEHAIQAFIEAFEKVDTGMPTDSNSKSVCSTSS